MGLKAFLGQLVQNCLLKPCLRGVQFFSFARDVETRLYEYPRQFNLDLARPKGPSWRLLAFVLIVGGDASSSRL